jgi:hypothetical protein
VELDPPPGLVRRVRITLTDLNQSAAGSVTLRDLTLNFLNDFTFSDIDRDHALCYTLLLFAM